MGGKMMFKIICNRCKQFIGYSEEDTRQGAVCLNCYGGQIKFKKGDRVTHIDYPRFGVGTVIKIAESGLRARVEFLDYDRHRYNWTPDAYYTFEKLRLESEAKA